MLVFWCYNETPHTVTLRNSTFGITVLEGQSVTDQPHSFGFLVRQFFLVWMPGEEECLTSWLGQKLTWAKERGQTGFHILPQVNTSNDLSPTFQGHITLDYAPPRGLGLWHMVLQGTFITQGIATSWICSACTLFTSMHLFLKRTFSLQLHVFPYNDNFRVLLIGDMFISLIGFQSSFSLGFVQNHSVATSVNPTQEQMLTVV